MSDKLLQGRYQVVQVLSAGGFCQTYIARDTHQPGRSTCVVKHLQPGNNALESLPMLRQLFVREAEALKKLDNYDRVPQLLDCFEDNQGFYLVQEFVAGQPLSAELQPNQRWTESQVVQLLQEVLGILEFVHSHALIHRDIKPSNLIRRQQDSCLVLIDFGAVKQVWMQVVTAQGRTSSTLALGIPATIAIGTPGYMPSEQERGRPRPNSDIYALGMIGIQALTGLNPTQLLEDSDTGEVLWQHQVQVSIELAAVLNKMVRYHFQDRYQTATEALQALQPLAKLHPPLPQHEMAPRPAVTATPMQASASEQETRPNLQGKLSALLVGLHASDPAPRSPHKSAALIRVGTGIASVLALMVGTYYFLQLPASQGQKYSVSIPTKNTFLHSPPVSTLAGHSDAVWSVGISTDSQTLVSSSADRTIKIWNLGTGQLHRTLSGHANEILAVAISPDKQTLATSSWDQTVKIWNLGTGQLRLTLSGDSNEVWAVAISPDGQTLASASGNVNKIWDLRTGELLHTLSGHLDTVWAVAISPDGQTLASGSKDQTIKIWNLQTGNLLRTLIGHSGRVRSVAISPDRQTLASGSWDQTIKIWDLRTGKLLRTLSGHSAYVNSVAISPDSRILASGSDDYTIKLWHLPTGELLRTFSGHGSNVNSVAFDAKGKILISGSGDKTIKIWRL